MTCCLLHNYIHRHGKIPDVSMDLPSDYHAPLLPDVNGHDTRDAKKVREMFLNYFNGEGAVHWQLERV